MARRKIEVYRDEAKRWRWHAIAPNGDLTSDSGQGYARPGRAEAAAVREYPSARIVRLPIGATPAS